MLERWNRQLMASEGIRFDVRAAFFPMTTPKRGSICLDIRLLGNFPVSQVAGYRCTLLAGNSSISLAESEELITFSQKSPKMLKMASERFVHFLLLFLGLFSKFPAGCPRSKKFFFPWKLSAFFFEFGDNFFRFPLRVRVIGSRL